MNCWFISTFIYLLNITHENILTFLFWQNAHVFFEIRDTSRWPESPRRRREPDLAWKMSDYWVWRVMCDTIVTPDTGQWQWPWLWLMPSACGLGTLQISDKIDIDPRVGSMLRQTAAVIRSWHAGLSWLLLHRAGNRAVISQSRRRPLLGPSYRFNI